MQLFPSSFISMCIMCTFHGASANIWNPGKVNLNSLQEMQVLYENGENKTKKQCSVSKAMNNFARFLLNLMKCY